MTDFCTAFMPDSECEVDGNTVKSATATNVEEFQDIKKKFAKVYWQTLNKHEDIKRESIKFVYKFNQPRPI